jgi:hypothetical protein
MLRRDSPQASATDLMRPCPRNLASARADEMELALNEQGSDFGEFGSEIFLVDQAS